ncbi:DUF2589 domain-containing protein [Streptomyces sp. NPDC003042]
MKPVDMGAELSLPFEQIIGGPLQAVIRSSGMAAQETVNFIKNVGFDSEGRLRSVKFSYNDRTHAEDPDKVTVTATAVEVPLLTVVPIPYLQLSKVTLDFNVKIDSVSTKKVSTDVGVESSASAGFWGVSASFKASFDHKSSQEDSVTRSTSLSVHVEAEQGEMPPGLKRILDLLDKAATTTPTKTEDVPLEAETQRLEKSTA